MQYKVTIFMLVILLVGGQMSVMGQGESEKVIKSKLINKHNLTVAFEKTGDEIELIYGQEVNKWKCESINTDKKGLGRWGLLLILVAAGGAIAGGVYAATADNNNHSLPQLPRGPLRGKFAK